MAQEHRVLSRRFGPEVRIECQQTEIRLIVTPRWSAIA